MDFIRDHQVFNAHVIWSVWKLIKYYNYEYYNQLFQNFMVLLKGQDSEKKGWLKIEWPDCFSCDPVFFDIVF